tara:strand:- start:388 stop:660 length:273 start_codon:yes stop_codon:yes gene_type:complete
LQCDIFASIPQFLSAANIYMALEILTEYGFSFINWGKSIIRKFCSISEHCNKAHVTHKNISVEFTEKSDFIIKDPCLGLSVAFLCGKLVA